MLAEPTSSSSSIERIFAFLHAKALEDSAEASGTSEAAKRREVDLLLEVIAETATELEREKSRTGQLPETQRARGEPGEGGEAATRRGG